MIFEIMKDVTTVTEGIVAHGCNCQGVMGAGVARAIKQTWPKAYSEYTYQCRNHTKETSFLLLGTVQIVQVDKEEGVENLYVANCFTQQYYGADGKVYADLAAIEEVFGNLIAYAEHYRLPIYIPKIGCGLGGLDWETQVKPLLEESAEGSSVLIYVCDLK